MVDKRRENRKGGRHYRQNDQMVRPIHHRSLTKIRTVHLGALDEVGLGLGRGTRLDTALGTRGLILALVPLSTLPGIATAIATAFAPLAIVARAFFAIVQPPAHTWWPGQFR